MGRPMTSVYYNKKGEHRVGVNFDYALALRIATGDLEALDEVARSIRIRVENIEKAAKEKDAT